MGTEGPTIVGSPGVPPTVPAGHTGMQEGRAGDGVVSGTKWGGWGRGCPTI